MSNWTYTAAERRIIDNAYSAVCYAADHMGHSQPAALRDALKYERRQRGSVTVAKALIVAGFANGRKHNPTAADLACISNGIMAATVVGADSRRFDGRSIWLVNVNETAKAAAAAHEAYMARNLAAAREARNAAAAG